MTHFYLIKNCICVKHATIFAYTFTPRQVRGANICICVAKNKYIIKNDKARR